MASTWSALKVELQGTGDNSGTWGTLTNANLGDAVLGEAITGSATVNFPTDADVTVTLTDSATSQSARNLRLNITESSTGIGSVRNLILGSGCQIEKFYLINNTGTGAKTVKNTTGTGISVPAGKATLVFNDGTNVVDGASYFTSLTLGSALPVLSGGTGVTTSTGSGNNVLSTSPVLTTPNLGTPSAAVLTSATGLPLTSGVTGLLPIANGGTATSTPALVAGTGVTISGTWPNQTINATGTGGTVTSVAGTGTVNGISLSGTVTSSGSLTLGGTLSGVANAALTNSSVTVTAGTGMSGGGAVALGSSITLTNAGVTSIVAGTGISISGATGAVTVSASGGAGFSAKTTTYTAASGDNILANTSSGSWTLTLPASPSTGNTVRVMDGFGTFDTYPLTVARNGQTIMGAAEDMTLSLAGVATTFVYNGSTWRVI